ncbi:MAG: hypothetical protein ACLQVF_43825 [Isosphaeraceae bacterium]
MQDTREEIRLGGQQCSASLLQDSTDASRRHPGRRKSRSRESAGGRDAEHGYVESHCRPRLSRQMSLEIAAREYVWLWDRRHGISIEAIAAREGRSITRVRFGVARARAQEKCTATTSAVRPPRLVPLFPIGAYTPHSDCAHRRQIEPGSSLCCMVCHASGMDRHPALRRDPRTDPAPEPKPQAAPEPAWNAPETRKERRQRLFGTHLTNR